jgi:hypothetical protein
LILRQLLNTNPNARLLRTACLLALAFVQGCGGHFFRPASVPRSAVWVDGVFIDCLADAQIHANRCTIFSSNSGEILEDGWFVLNTTNYAADTSELHYAAFGNRQIYLEDARRLVLWRLSERDPILRTMNDQLRTLATQGRAAEIDCQESASRADDAKLSDCALKAFANRRPFYVRLESAGVDSWGFWGLAGDANGNVSIVYFDSYEPRGKDQPRLTVYTCPKPVALSKRDGILGCWQPRGMR